MFNFLADHMNPPGLFDYVDEFDTILVTASATSTIVGDHIPTYLPAVLLFTYEGVNVYQKQLDDIQFQTLWLDDVSVSFMMKIFANQALNLPSPYAA